MEVLQKIEAKLDEIFYRNAPWRLPQHARKSIAGALWWLALIFGLLQLWAAWSFWGLGHYTDAFVDYANRLSVTYGTGEVTNHLGFFFYASLMVLALDAVLMLLAVPALRAFRKRRGWNYLFYSLLINAVYGLVRAFSEVGGGLGQLVLALLGSVVGAYFLFQIRPYFNGIHKPADHIVKVEKTTPKTTK